LSVVKLAVTQPNGPVVNSKRATRGQKKPVPRPPTEAVLRLWLGAIVRCPSTVEPFGLLREREPVAGQLLIRASYVRVAGLRRAAIGGVRSLSIIIGSR
jgi:hypothetical protein